MTYLLIIPFIIIALVLFIGAIVLQVFLSKKDSRRLGLILPGIYLAVSALIVLLVLLNTSSGMTTSTIDGISTTATTGTSIAATIGSALLVFIICNFPTAILLAIYYALGASRKNKKEIDKMNIQDLS